MLPKLQNEQISNFMNKQAHILSFSEYQKQIQMHKQKDKLFAAQVDNIKLTKFPNPAILQQMSSSIVSGGASAANSSPFYKLF